MHDSSDSFESGVRFDCVPSAEGDQINSFFDDRDDTLPLAMYIPSTAELRKALAEAHAMSLIRNEPGVLELLKQANPSWSVSSKVCALFIDEVRN